MTTLVRSKSVDHEADKFLVPNIPSPFPKAEHERLLQEEHTIPELPATASSDVQEGSSRVVDTSEEQEPSPRAAALELLPSIGYVQRSCIMTLNDLLSGSSRWSPIVPDRRHSMPSAPPSSSAAQVGAEQSSLALQTLVSNLRSRDLADVMTEIHPNGNETALIHELRVRVEALASTLEPNDARLAISLISLLSYFNRLSIIHASSPFSRNGTLAGKAALGSLEISDPFNPFDTLKRQLSDLQLERLSSQRESWISVSSPVTAVEVSLLWNRIDEELEKVLTLCRERTENHTWFSVDQMPPQYDTADYDLDTPPEYDNDTRLSIDDTKTRPSMGSASLTEKMRLDLEAVTMAIDRLYLVAPQLHNQRVELKSSKLKQMEEARQAGERAASRVGREKQREKDADPKELERLLDLLGKASERTLKSQSVFLEGGINSHIEKARLRDSAKRDAFVEHLLQHSDAGRLHNQDAELHQHGRIKDPDALLTLPEFIREAVPEALRQEDPEALLTLPEFVKEPPPPRVSNPPVSHTQRLFAKTKSRHRSLSAPSMSWLKPTSRHTESRTSRPTSSKGVELQPAVGFEVNYIAENHENLQHVLAFIMVSGATPGVDLEAEVLPSFQDPKEGDRLIIKSGPHTSLPLALPGRTAPGKVDIKVQSSHYEIKLTSFSSPSSAPEHLPLLDASQLCSSTPTSFICASCSLPLVHSSKIEKYHDLPSEHWQELVDAWMCHTDQRLHSQVAKHSKGFWPEAGQALVGGSYILFGESVLCTNNIYPPGEPKNREDWRLVRCLCGAVIGRCQQHSSGQIEESTIYRLLKYAIRPVSQTAEPFRMPLSAFIVEDMNEFVQAHATYRFIVFDEEDEKPRILIWLFKPNIRLAYTVATSYAIPKSASMHAAKVLYKILGPSVPSIDLKTILDKHPGFPQAEYLYYPMNICRRLAGLLAESNKSYPESMRTMTGLNVGWLRRA